MMYNPKNTFQSLLLAQANRNSYLLNFSRRLHIHWVASLASLSRLLISLNCKKCTPTLSQTMQSPVTAAKINLGLNRGASTVLHTASATQI
jgi:hypothetical protein